MPSHTPEEKQKKLDRLLSLLDADNALTKQDFIESFEKVINLVVAIQKQQGEAINKLEETYQILTERNRSDYIGGLKDLKGQVNDLFVGDQLKRIEGETKANFEKRQKEINDLVDKRLQEADERMFKLDESDKTSKKSLESLVGVTNLKIDQKIKEIDLFKTSKDEVIEDLKKEFEKIKNILSNLPRGQAMGRAKVPMPRTVDLTSDQNGVARVFTLPPDTVRIFGGISSQFPFAIASSDISRNGNQITLNSTIAPRETGQTLLIFTDALFYP